MINISINNKEYKVQEAKTPEEREKGLQGVKELPEDEGMLFYFNPPEDDCSFWMKDTLIPLDIIFIDEDLEVISVHKGEPESEEPIIEDDVSYVLEVNRGSGIKEGDILEFEEDNGPVMKVLAPDGSEQYALWGGERIFRRAFTKQLIRWIKKADAATLEEKQNRIYKRIGKIMFKEILAQDSRSPEYVTLKD